MPDQIDIPTIKKIATQSSKKHIQQRRVIDGIIRFVGRTFTDEWMGSLHQRDVIVAYNEYADIDVELYDTRGHFLGMAHHHNNRRAV